MMSDMKAYHGDVPDKQLDEHLPRREVLVTQQLLLEGVANSAGVQAHDDRFLRVIEIRTDDCLLPVCDATNKGIFS